MADMRRLDVQFFVSIDMDEVNAIKGKLSKLHPGTIDYCTMFDTLSNLRKHYISRLDGECAAYMNIAKSQIKEILEGKG